MAKIVRDARVLLKRTSTAGEVPIPGIGDDHTTWVGIPSGSSMIYNGEMFVNMVNARTWTRLTGTSIVEHTLFDLGYTPTNTQLMYLANGHVRGSSSMTFNSTTNKMSVTNLNVINLSGTNLTVNGPMKMMNIQYGASPYALLYDNTTSGISYYSLTINASNVSYTNPTYTTVASALDYLLYVTPIGNISVTGVTQFETGSSISSVILSWNVNKIMTSTIITAPSYNSGQLAPTMSGSVTDPHLRTANTTWTITVNDGTNTDTGTSTISFMNKAYWGISSNTSLSNSQIISLTNNILTTTRVRVITVAPSSQYWYYCIPASFGTPTFTIGGIENVPIATTQSFTNASGYSSSYNIYRSEFLLTGSITITIS
jgi:hypothetical protein